MPTESAVLLSINVKGIAINKLIKISRIIPLIFSSVKLFDLFIFFFL
jgi:hypothetical protein